MATARAERRLAAIMAADVVGYSRLVEADEAGTLAAIRDLRREVIEPLLSEHHGRIVKLMGDGAIAEFGSVVDAVACAVAVQSGVAARQARVAPERRIVFRIGINLGDVVVEGEDLLGDGVNVAARLEQLCEPGGVMLSGTAYDHLQGKLDLPLEFAGEQHLKNIDRPVRTYRVRLDGIRVASSPSRGRRYGWMLPTAAVALLALVLAGGAIWWLWPEAPAFIGRPSIAVLPFDNLGGDEATGRLAAGSPRTSSPICRGSATST
jgi:class 3 adenylate cyclase